MCIKSEKKNHAKLVSVTFTQYILKNVVFLKNIPVTFKRIIIINL